LARVEREFGLVEEVLAALAECTMTDA
jgi:hypothetical protein